MDNGTEFINLPLKEPVMSSVHGVVIKVENLNICRAFYRDVLRLGPPVIDSNFWVEFKLNGNSFLLLEEVAKGEKLPVCRGRISWLCKVDDFDDVVSSLKHCGHEPTGKEEERGGIKVLSFFDPEGNPFYIVADS